MIELSLPVRLYWDIAPETPADELLKSMCDEIERVPFLSLHICDTGSAISDAARYAVSSLAAPRRVVMLTLSPEAYEHLSEGLPELHTLFIAVTSGADIQRAARFHDRPRAKRVGISIPLTEIKPYSLFRLIQSAHESGFLDIHLPMQRAVLNAPAWMPDREEMAALAASVAAEPLPGSLRLNIHDPFLWRALNPSRPLPDGGCQAANTMVYLAPDGTLYPCPLMPVPLGNLSTESLTAILGSDCKRETRKQILEKPHGCDSCQQYALCHGGCRGRAYMTSGWEGADPACQHE